MGKAAVKNFFWTILITLSVVLAAATLAAGHAGKVSPVDSSIMPLLGLSIPILLIVNLIAAFIWGLAKKIWIIIPLIAIFGNWTYLTSIFQYHAFKEKDPEGKYLKIATYNVQSFGNEITGYSCREIAKYMQKEGVDILCLQEFGTNRYLPMDSIKSILSYWDHSVISTEDSINEVLPIAIFSRYPLRNEKFILFPNSSNSSMMCDVIVDADTIRLFNNHLQTTSVSQNRKRWEREMKTDDTREEMKTAQNVANTLHGNFLKRAEQTDSICSLAQSSPYPILICGDFNSIPSSYSYHKLSTHFKDGFKSAGHGYMYTYRYAKRLLRIDYIFHSADLNGVQYYSPNLELCSDHNPVLMEVEIKKDSAVVAKL